MFVDTPAGVGGFQMNLEAPIFQNKDFRTAMQYLFNFDRLNRNLWYSEYFRVNSFFEGTIFANPEVKACARSIPPRRANIWRRPAITGPQAWRTRARLAKLRNVAYGLLFTRSDTDDILVNDRGEKASFTLLYPLQAARARDDRHPAGLPARRRRHAASAAWSPALRSSACWNESSRWVSST